MRGLRMLVFVALLLAASPAWAGHGHRWGCGWGGYGGGYGGGYYYSSPFCGGYYGGFYDAYGPYGIYYSTRYGYADYYLPPIFAPSELIYGPAAVQRFWGINIPPAAPLVVRRDDDEPRKVRVANAEYRRKAEQHIAVGDMLFREQKYQQAIARYKQAAEMAPDMAESYWRRGHAYVATNRYELAAGTFKRALALDPDVRRAGFSLGTLYGPGLIAKTSHLESLAGEALAAGEAPDLYFLLGIFLRYDGQPDRAAKFFERAAELSGRDAAHLAGFLAPEDGAIPVGAEGVET